jgi:hypothetical protein
VFWCGGPERNPFQGIGVTQIRMPLLCHAGFLAGECLYRAGPTCHLDVNERIKLFYTYTATVCLLSLLHLVALAVSE